MVEPLSAVGAAASLVQLADVALRASREAYEFLSELRNARKEIQELRETLLDAETNVRSLRNYILLFDQSRNAVAEYEVLSELVTRSIQHFHHDIGLLKATLPRDLTLARRFKWVCNRSKIQGITKRITNRKSDLNLALTVTGRLHDLRLREDTTQLRSSLNQGVDKLQRQQTLSRTGIELQAAAFKDEILRESNGQSQLLQTLQQDQERYHLDLSGRVSALADQLLVDKQLQHQAWSTHPGAQRISRQSHANGVQKLNHTPSIDTLNETLAAKMSSSLLPPSSPALLTGILRHELRSSLKPILEQVVSSSETRGEALLRWMEDMVNCTNHRFEESTTAVHRDLKDPEIGWSPTLISTGNQSLCASNHHHFPGSTKRGYLSETVQSHHPTKSIIVVEARRWSVSWSIGTIDIILQQGFLTRDQRTSLSLYVHFRPNPSILPLPGITLFYSSAPTPQGYQIAPTIALYPIWTIDDPIFLAVCYGDLRGVQNAIASGEIHPKAQNKDGVGLHWSNISSSSMCRPSLSNSLCEMAALRFCMKIAACMGRLEISEFLLSNGLIFEEENAYVNPQLQKLFDLRLRDTSWGVSGVRFILVGMLVRHQQFGRRYSREKWLERKLAMADNFLPLLTLIGETMPDVLSETCDRLIQYWIQVQFNRGVLNGIGGDSDIFSEEIAYLLTKSVDIWRLIFLDSPLTLLIPSRRSLEFFSKVVTKGLLSTNYEAPEYAGSILVRALEAIHWAKQGIHTLEDETTNEVEEIVDAGSNETDDDEIESDQVPITSLVELLVRNGADIYWIYPLSIETAETWSAITTAWSSTLQNRDVEDEWFDALENCGLDRDEVKWGDKRRCQQTFRLRGATRSGVDEGTLSLPSTSGLRCRRCHKNFCVAHGQE